MNKLVSRFLRVLDYHFGCDPEQHETVFMVGDPVDPPKKPTISTPAVGNLTIVSYRASYFQRFRRN